MTHLSWHDFIAQLGERKTEDLEAPCSIHGEVKTTSLLHVMVLHGQPFLESLKGVKVGDPTGP